MALGTAPKVKALLKTSSPGFKPAHFIMSIMALPQEFNATQYLWPVYSVISTSHLDTVDSSALGTLYRYILPEDMRDTASSMPDWGTGSGVLMSRTIWVRMGLVRRALVDAAERRAAMASFVYFVAVMVGSICVLVIC